MGEHPSSATVPLGRYLWERIHQVGVNHIFGVPGDFNLTLLDHVYDVEGLEWVGNTNELNAAYAADGYARVKHGAGCVVTTHGVGELSALNAIAGAMTEQVKVIHVVGQTSRAMQQKRMMIHHSIGPSPDHQVFNKASRDFRVAAAELRSEQGAAEEIDRVLRECFVRSGPVYVFVPIDLVGAPVPAQRLETPLDLQPEVDSRAVEDAARHILETVSARKSPAIFVDCLVQRHQAVDEARRLVDALALPHYSSNMGKGIIDETNKHHAGLYNGEPSGAGVEAAFTKHDLVLVLGSLPSDTNTGGFTRKIPAQIAINIDPHGVDVLGEKSYSKTPIKAVLQRLTALAAAAPEGEGAYSIPTVENPKAHYPREPQDAEDHNNDDSNAITQSWVWHRLARFMRPHDVVFGETGTAAFGLPDTTFPADTTWITQTYYGSIGYATPAAMGAEVALMDLARQRARPRGRTLLVTGDGSLMLTVQEIGSMVKHALAPIVFIINNAGYTIERVIHGAAQSYNDIVPFDYAHMLQFFNVPGSPARASFHRAETREELDALLEKEVLKNPGKDGEGGVQVVEIVMDAMDVPWRLSMQIALRGPEAVKEMKEAGFKLRELQHKDGFWK